MIPFYLLLSLIEEKTIPELDIGEKEGRTGYIDFIRNEDMISPLMKGQDIYGRKFITIQFMMKKPQKDWVCVCTIFERYTDFNSSLAYGTDYCLNTLFDDSRLRGEKDIQTCAERINKLMRGESIYDMENKVLMNIPSIREKIKNQCSKLYTNDIVEYTILPFI
jgi:hypothetical protein